jgi:cytochrome b-561
MPNNQIISGLNIDYLLPGMLTHRMFRGWSAGALKCMHTVVTLTTLIFFLIGVYSVIASLNNLKSIHFSSVHSWLGMLSIISFLTSWISAFVIYIFPRFVEDIQSVLAPVHSFFGRIVFTLVCGAAVTGLNGKLRVSDTYVIISRQSDNYLKQYSQRY